MKNRPRKWTHWPPVAAGVLFCLSGCEETAKPPAQAHVPQIALPSQEASVFPLPINAHRTLAFRGLRVPNDSDRLAEDAQAAFDAGETDYKAGHLVKAREEFDSALDELLTSGVDLEA